MEDKRITSEYVRLRAENTRLRERVAALESSRWWRLHPRLAVSRLRARSASPARSDHAAETSPQVADELTTRFTVSVVERGSFGEIWFTNRIASPAPHLEELDGRAARILEIGSFEADAALARPLVEPGGLLVFDDYRWRALDSDPFMRPGPAIDAFLSVVGEHGDELFRNSQFGLRKEASWAP